VPDDARSNDERVGYCHRCNTVPCVCYTKADHEQTLKAFDEARTEKPKLYERVLAQFERYAGTDDCIDLQPVKDVADEIERLTQERDESLKLQAKFFHERNEEIESNARLQAALRQAELYLCAPTPASVKLAHELVLRASSSAEGSHAKD